MGPPTCPDAPDNLQENSCRRPLIIGVEFLLFGLVVDGHVPPSCTSQPEATQLPFRDTCQLLCCLLLTAGSTFNFGAVKLQLGAPLEAPPGTATGTESKFFRVGKSDEFHFDCVEQIVRRLTEFFGEFSRFVTEGHLINRVFFVLNLTDLQVRRRRLDSTATRPPPTSSDCCNSTEISSWSEPGNFHSATFG